jgi:hypothetical protein
MTLAGEPANLRVRAEHLTRKDGTVWTDQPPPKGLKTLVGQSPARAAAGAANQTAASAMTTVAHRNPQLLAPPPRISTTHLRTPTSASNLPDGGLHAFVFSATKAILRLTAYTDDAYHAFWSATGAAH